ncbi:MAG: hypothetical protein GX456_09240, partial [Verrucomicrobia bacterium]|nr:hypothetical protein [Verrucomicrobiota bacterium]
MGVGRREAFGVRQLAAALFLCPNYVPVPISASPAGALEETPALGSAAVLGRINPMTDLTTSFIHANPAPKPPPAGGGQEWPRSCTRWKKQRRRERGRPRPHQH